jgi:hypothetical protein
MLSEKIPRIFFSDWQVVSGQDGINLWNLLQWKWWSNFDGENAAYCLRAELNNTTMDAGIMHYITISLNCSSNRKMFCLSYSRISTAMPQREAHNEKNNDFRLECEVLLRFDDYCLHMFLSRRLRCWSLASARSDAKQTQTAIESTQNY